MNGHLAKPTEGGLATVIPLDCNPAAVYLAGLAPAGRRTMAAKLRRAAILLGQDDPRLSAEEIALRVPWHELRFQHVAAVRTRLIEEGAAPATANGVLCALRGAAKAAFALGLMTGEDYQRIRTVEAVKGERLPRGRALEPGEMRALLRACGKDETPAGRRDAAMIATLYACGLRRAEIVGLDLADLDLGKAEVRVRGKGNRERLVPIANGAGDALADWLAVRGDEAGPLFVPINKGGRLSLRRMTAEAAYNMLRKRAAEASVKDFSPHDLRRTFVSDLLDAGADLAVTQRMAGHANVQTTARYDRRGEEAKRKAASLLHVPYRRPAYLAEAETATA